MKNNKKKLVYMMTLYPKIKTENKCCKQITAAGVCMTPRALP